MEQRENIGIGNEISEEIRIRNDVNHGGCQSLIMFNIYLEEMIEEVLMEEVVLIGGGRRVEYIKFSDDIVVLGEGKKELVEDLDRPCKKYGIRINKNHDLGGQWKKAYFVSKKY